MRAWTMVDLSSNESKFDVNPAAFSSSIEEIIIFCGGDSTSVGVFNTTENTITKVTDGLRKEQYHRNSFSIIDGVAYIIGDQYGHIHTYDIFSRKFQDYDYSSVGS